MNDNFSELTTEKINPATAQIDECTTLKTARAVDVIIAENFSCRFLSHEVAK